MSEQQPQPGTDLEATQVATNVLATSAVTRAKQEAASQQLIELARQRAEHEGSAETVLFDEVNKLNDRMWQLHEHPFRARLAGKSALAVVRDYNPQYAYSAEYNQHARLHTEPIPDGVIGVHRGKELVISGLQFSVGYDGRAAPWLSEFREGLNTTRIQRLIENKNVKGASARQNLYTLYTYTDNVGSHVAVGGSHVSDLVSDRRKEVFDRYVSTYPEHAIYRPSEKEFGDDIFGRLSFWPEMGKRSSHSYNVAESLSDRLGGDMNRANSDLPEELYMEPLALVMQANLLLRAKRR